MRRPRLQINLRRMMLAVAVLSVSLATVVWMQRRAGEFRRITHKHANSAKMIELTAILSERRFGFVATDCRALHRKYERAARYPWLLVAPDPLLVE